MTADPISPDCYNFTVGNWRRQEFYSPNYPGEYINNTDCVLYLEGGPACGSARDSCFSLPFLCEISRLPSPLSLSVCLFLSFLTAFFPIFVTYLCLFVCFLSFALSLPPCFLFSSWFFLLSFFLFSFFLFVVHYYPSVFSVSLCSLGYFSSLTDLFSRPEM